MSESVPEKEIEITSEMICAGAKIVEHFRIDRDDPKEVARDVFVEMLAAMEHGFQRLGER